MTAREERLVELRRMLLSENTAKGKITMEIFSMDESSDTSDTGSWFSIVRLLHSQESFVWPEATKTSAEMELRLRKEMNYYHQAEFEVVYCGNHTQSVSGRFLTLPALKRYLAEMHIEKASDFEDKELPDFVPSDPQEYYHTSWGELLKQRKPEYASYPEAKIIARRLKLKDKEEFFKLNRKGGRPKRLPPDPENYYKEHFFTWDDFLGIDHQFSM